MKQSYKKIPRKRRTSTCFRCLLVDNVVNDSKDEIMEPNMQINSTHCLSKHKKRLLRIEQLNCRKISF